MFRKGGSFMHNYVFSGTYATYIEQLIVLKQKLGYKYTSAKELLMRFDRFTIEQEELKAGITKQLSDTWCERKGIESDKYRQGRVRVLVQLASFMNDLGIPSYIPVQNQTPEQAFVPYIYSRREIEGIFKACDEFRTSRRLMSSYIIMIPALFRLLYGTGLRINEALSILDGDINLESNYLVIRNSKNNQERLIPISGSLSAVCREYIKYRNMMPVSRENGYFFISLNGNKCKSGVVYGWFRKILVRAGIPYAGGHQGPRIHDLRHTFAVHSLAKMAESGLDLYCALPYLSTYLGHQSIRATNGYVRLTAEMYPGLLKNIDTVCLNVFPKIMCHETD
jgi:integrase